MNHEKNCLSYWFPKLQAAGVPVPLTQIIKTNVDLRPMVDGGALDEKTGFFIDLLSAAARRISADGPWFLRTGQGSGKHQWKRTCYVTDLSQLLNHVRELVEWSEMVDMLGLPYRTWCVREMLPVTPITTLPRYQDMPLVRELRCFVSQGRVVCSHDYWPPGAILEGFGRYKSRDFSLTTEMLECVEQSKVVDRGPALALAQQVATAFADDGEWSVDVLETDRGWYVTDMALAAESYHEDRCNPWESRHAS